MIVADTSVIIKTVVPETHSDTARRLRDQGMAAPSLWKIEAGNVLWRKQQTKAFSRSHAASLLDLLLNAPIVSLPFEDDVQPVFSIAAELEHPIYDCFFLAAAIREGTHVVTDDKRFAAAVRRHKKYANHLQVLAEL